MAVFNINTNVQKRTHRGYHKVPLHTFKKNISNSFRFTRFASVLYLLSNFYEMLLNLILLYTTFVYVVLRVNL